MIIRTIIIIFMSALLHFQSSVHGDSTDTVPTKPVKDKVNHFSPGKFDILVRSNGNSTDYNAILWTPVIKAGFGLIDLPGSYSSRYFGAFARPLQPFKNTGRDPGELIIGFNYVDHDGGTSAPKFDSIYWESQAEYRFKFGLGLGTGVVKSEFFESPAGQPRPYDYFVKTSYRGMFGDALHYTLSGQIQRIDDKVRPGGYAALYGKIGSISGGCGYESWRASIGYIFNKTDTFLRPAAEILFIDKTIGDNTKAPKILWINATLKFKGGFLSNPARLGRSMGPAGLEYGNPLPYLVPLHDGNPIFKTIGNTSPAIWNRALNAWELGGLLNFRIFNLNLPNEAVWGRMESVLFPFQFWMKDNGILDNIFLGGAYFYFTKVPAGVQEMKAPIVQGGIVRRISSLQMVLQTEYDTENKNITSHLGVINWF